MKQTSEAKSVRLLSLYTRFFSGQVLNKSALALEYGVTERSIQRDIESLRCFLKENQLPQKIVFDRKAGGYQMKNDKPECLTENEILAVYKILSESRSTLCRVDESSDIFFRG